MKMDFRAIAILSFLLLTCQSVLAATASGSSARKFVAPSVYDQPARDCSPSRLSSQYTPEGSAGAVHAKRDGGGADCTFDAAASPAAKSNQ